MKVCVPCRKSGKTFELTIAFFPNNCDQDDVTYEC